MEDGPDSRRHRRRDALTPRHTAVTRLQRQSGSGFAVGGFTGLSEEAVERVYGRHDPTFQKDIAGGVGYRKRT